MKSRDVVIGFIFLVILIAGVLWIFKNKNIKTSSAPVPTPNIVSRINNAFPNLDIPDGVERANLNDVTGGQNVGIATRTEILANLPELTAGKVYKAWLENSSGNKILLGSLRISKSGWIVEYNSGKFPGYNKVLITLDEKSVLEGSF
jgi:hypothetical protein